MDIENICKIPVEEMADKNCALLLWTTGPKLPYALKVCNWSFKYKTVFIVWNKLYHNKAGSGKTPNPKDLFSSTLFNAMSLFYLAGLLLFITGIFMKNNIVLQSATFLLLATAVLYNWNILKMLLQKPMIQ